MAEELSRVLHGALSDEAMHQRIDAIAAELRPEMERNGQRWGMRVKDWERMVSGLHNYVDGRAVFVAGNFREKFSYPREDFQLLFGDLTGK